MAGLDEFMESYNKNVVIKGTEILDEITIYKGDGITISVNRGETGTNFSKDPYFKVYNSEDPSSANLVARVKANGSGYDYHTDGKGKIVWDMTKDRNILVKVLNKPPKGGDRRIMGCETTWDAIKAGTDIEFGTKCVFPDTMPDFSNITFDKSKLNGRRYARK